jgi:hypothetical protein
MLEGIFRAGLTFGVPVSISELGVASGQRSGNVRGSWVEKSVTALGTNTFTHNLNLPTPTGVLNVRWLLFGVRHNGTGAGAGDVVCSPIYQGGTVGSDSIDLYVTAAGARTVDGSNPLTLTMFFMPADG